MVGGTTRCLTTTRHHLFIQTPLLARERISWRPGLSGFTAHRRNLSQFGHRAIILLLLPELRRFPLVSPCVASSMAIHVVLVLRGSSMLVASSWHAKQSSARTLLACVSRLSRRRSQSSPICLCVQRCAVRATGKVMENVVL